MTDPYGSDAGRLEAALARWLADRGIPDPGACAAELVHMVRGHGWRPIAALQPPERREDRPAPGPTAEYLAAKAAITRERNP